MKEFKYTKIAGGTYGFIAMLQHKTYDCTIQIFEGSFYIGGRDCMKVSLNKKTLKTIKRIQKGTFERILKGDKVQSVHQDTKYIVNKVNDNDTFDIVSNDFMRLEYKGIKRKHIKKVY